MPMRQIKFSDGYRIYKGIVSDVDLTIWCERIDIVELASICHLEVATLRRILALKFVAPGDILFQIVYYVDKLAER